MPSRWSSSGPDSCGNGNGAVPSPCSPPRPVLEGTRGAALSSFPAVDPLSFLNFFQQQQAAVRQRRRPVSMDIVASIGARESHCDVVAIVYAEDPEPELSGSPAPSALMVVFEPAFTVVHVSVPTAYGFPDVVSYTSTLPVSTYLDSRRFRARFHAVGRTSFHPFILAAMNVLTEAPGRIRLSSVSPSCTIPAQASCPTPHCTLEVVTRKKQPAASTDFLSPFLSAVTTGSLNLLLKIQLTLPYHVFFSLSSFHTEPSI